MRFKDIVYRLSSRDSKITPYTRSLTPNQKFTLLSQEQILRAAEIVASDREHERTVNALVQYQPPDFTVQTRALTSAHRQIVEEVALNVMSIAQLSFNNQQANLGALTQAALQGSFAEANETHRFVTEKSRGLLGRLGGHSRTTEELSRTVSKLPPGTEIGTETPAISAQVKGRTQHLYEVFTPDEPWTARVTSTANSTLLEASGGSGVRISGAIIQNPSVEFIVGPTKTHVRRS